MYILDAPDQIIQIVAEFATCDKCAQPLHIMDKYLYEESDNHTMSAELHYYWCKISRKFYCVPCVKETRLVDYCNRIITPVYLKEADEEVKWCCYELVDKSKLKQCANFAHGDNDYFNTICICKKCIGDSIENRLVCQWKCVICKRFICSNCYDGGVYSPCEKCHECESKNDSHTLYCIDCDDDLHDFNCKQILNSSQDM